MNVNTPKKLEKFVFTVAKNFSFCLARRKLEGENIVQGTACILKKTSKEFVLPVEKYFMLYLVWLKSEKESIVQMNADILINHR